MKYYMTHEEVKRELLKDPEFAKAYNTPDLAYEIGRKVKRLRIQCGFTQAVFAKKLKTKQSSIARLECGDYGLPSLSFLKRIADATGTTLIVPGFKENVPMDKVVCRRN